CRGGEDTPTFSPRKFSSIRVFVGPGIPIYRDISFGAKERRDLAMAAKKAKGDDWFSSLDAELEKKTREIIEDVGEQNVARLELNKTLIEDFWKVWKRFNKINVHFALEPSYT